MSGVNFNDSNKKAMRNPMTAAGDVIYGDVAGVPLALPIGMAGQVLTVNAGATAVEYQTPGTGTFYVPTVQVFLSGSGTYTTPTSPRTPLYLVVEMVGGGGGGGGGGASPGTATAGGNTTFSGFTAGGGAGAPSGGGAGGGGGTCSGGAELEIIGQMGGTSDTAARAFGINGGFGGNSFYSGSGWSGPNGTGGTAVANTGSGGGGGGGNTLANPGSGGGAGAFSRARIGSPTSTYSFSVGAFGAAGSAGTSGQSGGNGSVGRIIVTEYYQ